MARSLDDQANSYHPSQDLYLRNSSRAPSPQPPPSWVQGGSPPLQYPRQLPYLPTPQPSPPQQYLQQPQYFHQQQQQQYRPSDALSPAMASLSFSNQQQPIHPRTQSVYSTYGPPPKPPSPPKGPPSLTAQLPTISSLSAALPSIQQPTYDPAFKVAWCKDVIFLVDRLQQGPAATDPPNGPARITEPQLLFLSQIAVPLILQISSQNPLPQPIPSHVAEAIYLRATFASSGAYPDHVRQHPRSAFRDFEQAARAGYSAAWFRLGRDYENFNDFAHAKDCFERGIKLGVESCAYVSLFPSNYFRC